MGSESGPVVVVVVNVVVCAWGASSECSYIHYTQLDSGEKFTSDLPYKQPESTKSSGQRELQAQACENMLRTRSAISNNPGAREVIPSTSVGWIFVTKESPSP